MKRLDQLMPGESGIVQELSGDGAFRRRLLELGFVPGTSIELVNVAPLGDPLKLRLRNSEFSLRRVECAAILVRSNP